MKKLSRALHTLRDGDFWKYGFQAVILLPSLHPLTKCYTLMYILTFGIPSKNCLILSISSTLPECKVCNNKLTLERILKDNISLIHAHSLSSYSLSTRPSLLACFSCTGRTGQMLNLPGTEATNMHKIPFWDMPLLFRTTDALFLAITQAVTKSSALNIVWVHIWVESERITVYNEGNFRVHSKVNKECVFRYCHPQILQPCNENVATCIHV